jgi:hypothetical protein
LAAGLEDLGAVVRAQVLDHARNPEPQIVFFEFRLTNVTSVLHYNFSTLVGIFIS